jgi:uncharacterized radical SAM superfamily Fe-S cluster-containing enzyme
MWVITVESDVVTFRMSNEQIKQILEESMNKTGLKPKNIDVRNGEVVVVYDLVSVLNRITSSYGITKIDVDESGITIYIKRRVIGIG